MFRWDRAIVSVSITVSWLILIYLLVVHHTESNLWESQDTELRAEIENLRTKYEKLSQNSANTPELSRQLTDGDDHFETKSMRAKRLLNIFIETNLDGEQIQTSRKQFYKTFGAVVSYALFESVRKLPEHLRKRVLVTGGAGFVGKLRRC